MITRPAAAIVLTSVSAVIATATPAAAGGIGDLLSPAFGVTCANLNNGARAHGATTHDTGAANGNLASLPIGNAFNQCGGADAPALSPLECEPLSKILDQMSLHAGGGGLPCFKVNLTRPV
ncbi:hypothetical protein [Streptomyces rimosus]|uniref:hypothetical protein n=1 Tax=Streptomyces rimosus TaxID=1927 RepID=UPI0004C716E5|nr:hypothetical protein [Streptomyces rimosus]